MKNLNQELTSICSSASTSSDYKTEGTYLGEGGLKYCSKCNTPREVELDTVFGVKVVPCLCECQLQAQREEESRLNRARQQRREELKAEKAFTAKGLRLDTFDKDDGAHGVEQMKTARAYADKFLEEAGGLTFGLLFYGHPDAGKTFACAAIANKLIDNGYTVIMRSLPDIVEAKEQRDTEIIQEIRDCDLLILDDLGAERETSFGREAVYAAIDARYARKAPMIIATNLSREELMDTQDLKAERIYHRVLGSTLPVKFDTGRKRVTKDKYEEYRKELGL